MQIVVIDGELQGVGKVQFQCVVGGDVKGQFYWGEGQGLFVLVLGFFVQGDQFVQWMLIQSVSLLFQFMYVGYLMDLVLCVGGLMYFVFVGDVYLVDQQVVVIVGLYGLWCVEFKFVVQFVQWVVVEDFVFGVEVVCYLYCWIGIEKVLCFVGQFLWVVDQQVGVCQWKEIWVFLYVVGVCQVVYVVFGDFVYQVLFLQVVGGKQQYFVVLLYILCFKNYVLVFVLLLYFRVVYMVGIVFWQWQYWFQFVEGVIGIFGCQILSGGVFVVGEFYVVGVVQSQGIFEFDCVVRVVVVVVIFFIWYQGDRFVLLVQQIGRVLVFLVFIGMVVGEWVLLIKQVVMFGDLVKVVRIVQQFVDWCQMLLWIMVVGQCLWLVLYNGLQDCRQM